MKKNYFETIFTSNDDINIQDVIDKGFGFRERAYSMVVNAYFGPRGTHIPHATPKYAPGKLSFKLIIIDRNIFLHKK